MTELGLCPSCSPGLAPASAMPLRPPSFCTCVPKPPFLSWDMGSPHLQRVAQPLEHQMGWCVQVLPLPCLLSFPPLAGTPLQLVSSSKFSVRCHCHEQMKVHCDLVLVDRGPDWRVSCPGCEPSGPAPHYLHTPLVGKGCGECGTPTGFSFFLDPHILRSCPSPKWIP